MNKNIFKNNTLPLVGALIYVIFSFGLASVFFLIVLALLIFFVFRFAKHNQTPVEAIIAMFDNLTSKKINKTINYNGNVVRNAEISDNDSSKKLMERARLVKWTTGALLLSWLFWSLIVIIDAGETGVYSLFGKVKDNELRSGFHLVNPLAKITKMTIRTEEYTMSKVASEGKRTGDDSIAALTREGLSVTLDVTVFYRLEENKASDIYKEVGVNYVEKIIRPEIRGAIRDVVARYEIKEIYSDKRQEASQAIRQMLQEKLNPRGIVAEDVLVRDVSLPQNLANAIQEKLKSEQESQRYDFVLDREKKEAERKIIEAEGQRDAQKIIDESLSEKYLNYLYIKELKDRQGTVYVPVSASTGMPMFKSIE